MYVQQKETKGRNGEYLADTYLKNRKVKNELDTSTNQEKIIKKNILASNRCPVIFPCSSFTNTTSESENSNYTTTHKTIAEMGGKNPQTFMCNKAT